MEQASLTAAMQTAMQMMQNAMQMMQNAMQNMQKAMQMYANIMQNDANIMQNMQNDAKLMQNDANLHKADAKPHAKCTEHISAVRRAAALKRWHKDNNEKLMQNSANGANSANDANLHNLHDFVGKENETEKENTPLDNPLKEKDKEKEKDKKKGFTPAHTCEPVPADEHTGARARKDGAIHVEDLDKRLSPFTFHLSPSTFHLSPPTHPRRVIPPTVEMVAAYCRSRQNGIDAEAFVDFYASRGWMVGKVKMKDWQAAVRTWEHRRREEQQQQTINNNRYDNTHSNQQSDFAGNAADRKPYSRVQELANTRFALD